MSVFESRIPNENTSKPFYKNASPSDQIDWFQRTRGWHALPLPFVEELVRRFAMSPMFEAFVLLSHKHGLIPRYQLLCGRLGAGQEDIAVDTSSGFLMELGRDALKAFVPFFEAGDLQEASTKCKIANDAFDCAAILTERDPTPYWGKATVAAFLGRHEDRIASARLGLQKAEALAGARSAMERSSVEGLGEAFDAVHEALKALARP